jgi:hypothetical protein
MWADNRDGEKRHLIETRHANWEGSERQRALTADEKISKNNTRPREKRDAEEGRE